MKTACKRARERFPDLSDGVADAGARAHLDGCDDCTRSFETFRTIVGELERLSESTAPDPGRAYWDGFLPSVRGRLDAMPASSTSRRVPVLAACAAAVMVMLSLAVLLSPAPPRVPSLDEMFESARNLPPDQARSLVEATADLVGVSLSAPDLAGDLDPEEVVQALDQIRHPGGLTDLWQDQEIEEMLLRLDDSEAALLKQELQVTGAPGPGRSL